MQKCDEPLAPLEAQGGALGVLKVGNQVGELWLLTQVFLNLLHAHSLGVGTDRQEPGAQRTPG